MESTLSENILFKFGLILEISMCKKARMVEMNKFDNYETACVKRQLNGTELSTKRFMTKDRGQDD